MVGGAIFGSTNFLRSSVAVDARRASFCRMSAVRSSAIEALRGSAPSCSALGKRWITLEDRSWSGCQRLLVRRSEIVLHQDLGRPVHDRRRSE